MPAPSTQPRCAILGTLDVLGDLWTLGILRCVFYGQRRYTEIQRELGIATNVLADRLDRLVTEGILERVPYQERPLRHEYIPTEKGAELAPALIALRGWGQRHLRRELSPLTHRGCGGEVSAEIRCSDCQRSVDPAEITSADAEAAPPA